MPEATATQEGDGKREELLFGNFQILTDERGKPHLLGKGSFGRTYKARHRYVETLVALKVVGERFATDPVVRQRFLVEGRAAARLSHPNMARLYDFGEKDGLLYYAMDYCDGGDLAAYVVKNGPLSSERLMQVAREIAAALQCAHEANLIHRDVKPSNIMLTGTGGSGFTTKLIDFGLVHAVEPAGDVEKTLDESSLTQSKSRFVGTPLFASPEQLREEPLDGRSDLFSLGMTLWYLAIGAPPEGGSLAQIATSRLNADSYAARLPINMPPELHACLARLLEKDPAKRMATAAELVAALAPTADPAAMGSRATAAAPIPGEDVPTAVAPPSDAVSGDDPLANLEEIPHPLEHDWRLLSRAGETLTGVNYTAESLGDAPEPRWVHVLSPVLLEDPALLDLLRRHVATLVRLRSEFVLTPLAVRRYTDYTVILLDRPDTGELLNVLRAQAKASLAEALPILDKLAQTADAMVAAGLPPPDLHVGRILLRTEGTPDAPTPLAQVNPVLFPKFLASGEAPALVSAEESAGASGTMTDDMLDDPSQADDAQGRFAMLIYRMIAGRDCPQAAALTTQAYVSMPGLSEPANRFLSLVIARQATHVSCGDMLRQLLQAEGLGGGHGSTGNASVTATGGTFGSRSFHTGTVSQPHPSASRIGYVPGTAATQTQTFAPVSATPTVVTTARPPTWIMAVAGVVALTMFLTVGALVYKQWVQPNTAGGVAGGAGAGGTLAEGATARMHADGLPAQAVFSYNGKELSATRAGGDVKISVGGLPRKFPLELTVEAHGFKPGTMTISDENSLGTAQPACVLYRSTGKMVFVGEVMNYTQVSASMVDLLPDEKGLDLVSPEPGDRAVPVREGGRNSLELATGIYTVSARDDRRITPKLFLDDKFEVKAGETVSVRLK